MPTLATSDGACIFYSTTGSGKDTLILLHNLGGDSSTWSPLLPHLDRHDLRIIAIDFRGTGNSQREPCELTNERLAHDVLEVAKAEKAERFVLFGHSMGAKLGLFLAATAPERIIALAVLGCPSPALVPIPREIIENYLAQTDRRRYAEAFYRPWFSVRPRPEIDKWIDSFASMPDWALRASCESSLWTDFSERTKDIACPILALIGAKDPVYGPDYYEASVKPHLPSPTTALIDCGHGFMLERPKALAPRLNKFLRQCLA